MSVQPFANGRFRLCAASVCQKMTSENDKIYHFAKTDFQLRWFEVATEDIYLGNRVRAVITE